MVFFEGINEANEYFKMIDDFFLDFEYNCFQKVQTCFLFFPFLFSDYLLFLSQ